MKIYISGKITGLDVDIYTKKFQKAEDSLIAAGVPQEDIINPCKLGIPVEASWEEAKEKCLTALLPCTAIYMLSDWINSRGAKWELVASTRQQKHIYFESNGDIHLIHYKLKSNLITQN